MKTFTHVIKDPVGLHARPAADFVTFAKTISSEIRLECAGKSADAKRLMQVMAMGAGCGSQLTVTVSGETEQSDCSVVESYMKDHV